MLQELSIRDVVLIDALDLEIGSGFTALTGETGAGKSILLDALGMALGERTDKGLVRAGASKAIASATFEINNSHAAHQILKTSEIEVEDGIVVLRRIVAIDGKSRAFINDVPVSIATLRQIASHLLEVHGQHSAIGLIDQVSHLTMLDLFLSSEMGDDFTPIQADVAAKWANLVKAQTELAAAKAHIGTSLAEREYLAHVLSELQTLAPTIGEEASLDAER
ncbi:MAG: DNA repair protein RecN (Recombination protein N), partial [Hyphomonadaceae bacterium]